MPTALARHHALLRQAIEFPALKSLDSFPNNLPIQLTSFIGRRKETAEIVHLLSSSSTLQGARHATRRHPGNPGRQSR